ncbi:MAG: T9SS type A sorting domain-containing protein [Ignavibacteriales bacterium]|nr:T9SS type A sorting domain-containing protein [Ignavibacteriales bacterium]
MSSVLDIKEIPEIPSEDGLKQNYPNPFNPKTTINYNLKVNSKVILKIYDLLGREITTLVDGEFSAGRHTEIFNAVNLSTGVYFYKLEAVGIDGSKFTDTKK